MLHTCRFESEAFQGWLKASNYFYIATQFHLTLLEELWKIGINSFYQIILSFQRSAEIQEDLKDFGGFIFDDEILIEEKNLSIGLMNVTAKTYQSFLKKKESILKDNLNSPFLSTILLKH